jgi:hypothetical protein
MLPVAAILDRMSLSVVTVHATCLVLLVVNYLLILTGAWPAGWLCSLTMNFHFNLNLISGFCYMRCTITVPNSTVYLIA